jgi:predicted nucleic acid-binding protein
MTDLYFVDTNVLVYARDSANPEKQESALDWIRQLWTSRAGRLSVQVLNEYYVTVTRKLQPGMSIRDAREDVRNLAAWRPLPLDDVVVESAWTVEDRFGLSWWDSLIVAAAQVAGCRFLLSEDLQHEQELDGITILNPFTAAPMT